MTAQGHPRAIFKRAIDNGNIAIAEMAARELGRLTLDEALRLVFLYAEKEPIKFERAALRWLARYVTERKGISLLKAQVALSALAELRCGERGLRRSCSPSWRRGSVAQFRQRGGGDLPAAALRCRVARPARQAEEEET